MLKTYWKKGKTPNKTHKLSTTHQITDIKEQLTTRFQLL